MPTSSSSPPSLSRTHTVPTHLNLPDQVLTLWSFGLTARQLLLLLVGSGISGDLWHALAFLSHETIVGQVARVILTLIPFLVTLVVAWYRHGGRSLEVWCLVLLRYRLQPKRFVWRTLRAAPTFLPSQTAISSNTARQARSRRSGTALSVAHTELEEV